MVMDLSYLNGGTSEGGFTLTQTDKCTLQQVTAIRQNLQKWDTNHLRPHEKCPEKLTDSARGFHSHKNPGEKTGKENFDQKIYMFPPAFNALREELYNNWQDSIWPLVAWRMVNNAEEFVEVMNAVTGLKLLIDSDAVNWICDRYWHKLRKMRGLSR